VEIASADKARHRLSRTGDRQLNSVLHTTAMIQIRMPDTPGHAYYEHKIAEGKTAKEAKRCLKRRSTNHVWRMLTDERRNQRLPQAEHGALPHTSCTITGGLLPLPRGSKACRGRVRDKLCQNRCSVPFHNGPLTRIEGEVIETRPGRTAEVPKDLQGR